MDNSPSVQGVDKPLDLKAETQQISEVIPPVHDEKEETSNKNTEPKVEESKQESPVQTKVEFEVPPEIEDKHTDCAYTAIIPDLHAPPTGQRTGDTGDSIDVKEVPPGNETSVKPVEEQEDTKKEIEEGEEGMF